MTRKKKPKIGRPRIGKGRSVEVTVSLPQEQWDAIIEAVGERSSKSAAVRAYLDYLSRSPRSGRD